MSLLENRPSDFTESIRVSPTKFLLFATRPPRERRKEREKQNQGVTERLRQGNVVTPKDMREDLQRESLGKGAQDSVPCGVPIKFYNGHVLTTNKQPMAVGHNF